MRQYYQAQWPILDEDLTVRRAVVLATPDLYRMMAADAVVMTGEPEWSTSEVAGQSFLNVRVPARRADT